ncbi:hypothetical protein CW354_15535 [Marinicaulis flavus]|uniref:Uncharacterized protein n=2 Tax=Hyphococcus luteus TaxID=2058213 RepID=A0A2S7K307_9PROT|nr:hypothetical protein CW354_15535 [Marinicaulis flavus]
MGNVRLSRAQRREIMTALIMLAKGVMLIVLALAAFAGLAMALGFEPAGADEIAKCNATPAPVCLFTIL